jgi:hypothetical protein
MVKSTKRILKNQVHGEQNTKLAPVFWTHYFHSPISIPNPFFFHQF